ncbi:hypothetical protein BH11ARM2_BH11ARM2_35530 [soil metagenome]
MATIFEGIWQAHEGQKAFLDSDASIRVLACGLRWGKTEACAADMVARMHGEAPSRQLIVAPTLTQARLLFDRASGLLDRLLRGRGEDPKEAKVRQSPFPLLEWAGHQLWARSGHRPGSLRGDEADHVIVDEAAFVPEPLVADVLHPMLATTGGRLTLLSTPNGRNWFWRYFRRGEEGGAGIWSRRGPSSENPKVPASFLDARRDMVSERTFRTEYEAAFTDVQGALLRQEAIEAALTGDFGEELRGEIRIGVDWGRLVDFTAVAVLVGTRARCWLVETVQMGRTSWDSLVERVAAIVRRYPGAVVICDASGVGDGITPILRNFLNNFTVREFKFNANNRDELLDNLATLFETNAVRFRPDPLLQRQLEMFVAKPGRSKVRYEAAPGEHDDLVMALALAALHLPSNGGRLLIRQE